jgi:hypothetical protein
VISADQQSLALDRSWEVNCWYSDSDLQLLDLDMTLDRGITLNRTILFAREDQFVFVADALTAAEPRAWDYRLRIPLADGISALEEDKTREVYFRRGDQIAALALPLAAPEWKSTTPAVGFSASSNALSLHYSRTGRNLYAPVFCDMNPRRSVQPRTWRSLTVAKDRSIQTPDSAVGFRVRCGSQQWLLFRAFGAPAIYSVLSKHLFCEFYFGRIEPDRTITDLIQLNGN